MKENNKCPNCGATVEYNEDKSIARCPYCHSSFEVDKEQPKQTATIKDLQDDDRSLSLSTEKSGINIVIFIILFAINPVIAIVYAIIKSSKPKK